MSKGSKTRIKIWVEESTAKATMIICYVPKCVGMPFTWEIKEIKWDLTVEGDRNAFEQILHSYKKEESRNFKIAFGEATQYSRFASRKKELEYEVVGSMKFYKPFSIQKGNTGNSFICNPRSLFQKRNKPQESTSPNFQSQELLISKEEILAKILTAVEDHS